MIGIYDSGSGGLTALCELRKHAKNADILYRGDLKHAPYGTKTREVLLPILKENLNHLKALGCEYILVACMTASSLIPFLPEEEKQDVYPILHYVCERAISLTKTGRIGIVSTSRTMKEGAMRDLFIARGIEITQTEADALVPLAEQGQTDPRHPSVKEAVERATKLHRQADIDTLILGCTHFPYFTKAFRQAMGNKVHLIPSGEVGACGFLKQIPKDVLKGQGHIHFI